jgi:hypothetical protein
MANRPAHLTRGDYHFLAAVAGDQVEKARALEDEVDHHLDEADRLAADPTVEEGDIGDDGESRFAADEARRTVRARTREIGRRARAAAVAGIRSGRRPGA